MRPTISFDETLDTYRRYGIQMSQAKLTELLQRGRLPFAESIELSTWSYTIWRKDFYEYLASHGVPVKELSEYMEQIRREGWRDEWQNLKPERGT